MDSEIWSRKFLQDSELYMLFWFRLVLSDINITLFSIDFILLSSSFVELIWLDPVATSSMGWKCSSRALLSKLKLFVAGIGIVSGVWGAGCSSTWQIVLLVDYGWENRPEYRFFLKGLGFSLSFLSCLSLDFDFDYDYCFSSIESIFFV